MAVDLGEWVLQALKTDSSVTDRVMDDAIGVIESGELLSKDVEDAERRRLEDEATLGTRVLRVLVQDRGEFDFESKRFSRCTVFVFDRRKGYRNIRAVRELVLAALVAQRVTLTRLGFIVKLNSVGRTGHSSMENYDLEFEGIDMQGQIVSTEPDLYR